MDQCFGKAEFKAFLRAVSEDNHLGSGKPPTESSRAFSLPTFQGLLSTFRIMQLVSKPQIRVREAVFRRRATLVSYADL